MSRLRLIEQVSRRKLIVSAGKLGLAIGSIASPTFIGAIARTMVARAMTCGYGCAGPCRCTLTSCCVGEDLFCSLQECCYNGLPEGAYASYDPHQGCLRYSPCSPCDV